MESVKKILMGFDLQTKFLSYLLLVVHDFVKDLHELVLLEKDFTVLLIFLHKGLAKNKFL